MLPCSNMSQCTLPGKLCWAHIRRKFVECANSGVDKDWCNKVILKLAELYRIEKEAPYRKGSRQETHP